MEQTDNGTIIEWNFDTGACLMSFKAHDDKVRCFEETWDGKILSGSWDKTIKVWSEDWKCLIVLKGHTDCVVCLENLGLNLIASGSVDNTIKLWDLENGCYKTLQDSNIVSKLKKNEKDELISSSWDIIIKIWDIDSGCCLKSFKVHETSIFSIEMDQNYNNVFSASSDYTVKMHKIK